MTHRGLVKVYTHISCRLCGKVNAVDLTVQVRMAEIPLQEDRAVQLTQSQYLINKLAEALFTESLPLQMH